jgi:hypothetical protein
MTSPPALKYSQSSKINSQPLATTFFKPIWWDAGFLLTGSKKISGFYEVKEPKV